MKTVEWVVKASKFCNLRCAYCYEWNSLGDRERLSIDGWRRALDAVRCYHVQLEYRLRRPVESHVIWHGGEPLTLPVSYLDEVMTLQHAMLDGLPHRVMLQTNLYHLPDATIDLLQRHRIGIGVSMDVIGGARVDVGGHATEETVVANLDRLERRGLRHGAITWSRSTTTGACGTFTISGRAAEWTFACCRCSQVRPSGPPASSRSPTSSSWRR